MNSSNPIDLRSEVLQAKLDPHEISRLITPAGFSLKAAEDDGEILELKTPSGACLDISRAMELAVEDDDDSAITWYIELPTDYHLLGVLPETPSYGIERFVRDIVERFVELDNETNPEMPPSSVVWE